MDRQACRPQSPLHCTLSAGIYGGRCGLCITSVLNFHIYLIYVEVLQLYYVCSSPHAIHLDNHVDDIIITYLVTEEKSECMLFALSSVHSLTHSLPTT